MMHLTELQCVMYADGEVRQPDPNAEHVEGCMECQRLIDAVRQEKRVIASALAQPLVVDTLPFVRPAGFSEFLVASAMICAITWLGASAWQLASDLIPGSAMTWLLDALIPGVVQTAFGFSFYMLGEGTSMLQEYIGLVGLVVAAASVLVVTWLLKRSAAAARLMMSAVLLLAVIYPEPAAALEIRRGTGMVSIPSTETINDSVLMGGDTIVVDGTVNGDLLVAGERVLVNGTVNGNLVALGEAITITGVVTGSVLSAGSTVELAGANVKADVWGIGESVSLGEGSRVERNATVAANSVVLAGQVSRDAYAFGERIEVSGGVGEDLEAFGSSAILMATAKIDGDVRFRTDDEDHLQQSPGATVGGEITFLPSEHDAGPENRYLSLDFYLTQLLRLVSALLVGLLLLWFMPNLGRISLGTGSDALKVAATGFGVLVGLPVLMGVLAITIVGIPLAILTLFGWIVIIYLAKILLALVVGRMLLADTQETFGNLALVLLAGLGILLVLVNIPFVGGVLNVVFIVLGAGLIAMPMWRLVRV